MTYVITDACIQAGMCAMVCPVDCIYDAGDHFMINPEECIDCGLCNPECPVDAIYPDYQLPEEMEHFKTKAAEFDYSGMAPAF
jgi:NAD-dependent dihydropyrimidine dehydrogenase PreA subunit